MDKQQWQKPTLVGLAVAETLSGTTSMDYEGVKVSGYLGFEYGNVPLPS